MKQIDIEQRKSYLSQKEHGNKLTYCLQEIEHIKDILAKKANFTDVVLHVDRKADREDVKELELRFSCPKMNVSNAVINRAQRTEAVRNKPRESRTVMHTTPIRNRYKLDLSSKIFMCGGDDFVPSESRQLFSQNSKRKSLKTTTACGNDFTL